jgi:hypothetical protein
MSFQSVWGFDPDEVIGFQELSPHEPNADEFGYEPPDERLHDIPAAVDAQIYELRRMFGS